jgi:hypothetical protein
VGGFWVADSPWDGPGNYINSLGWNGTNVTVSIADSGIGNGSIGNAGHLDFEDRVINGTQYGTLTNWADGNAHGTHVAGIVAGDGFQGTGVKYPISKTSQNYYLGLGVASDAKLFAQRIFDSGGSFEPPSSWNAFFQDAYDAGAYIHQNSWGEGTGDSAYETYDREYDQAVRDSATSTSGDQSIIIIVSAGNSGSNSGTIESPASGKNVITVGASENYHPNASTYGETAGISADNINEIASFSSRGLEDDGRIKPDIMAPGTAVLSAKSPSGSSSLHGVYSQDSRYLWCSGTSQAAPHVSGGVASIVEWWQTNNNGSKPSPALVKASMINTADDMGSKDIPNNNEGWGRLNLTTLLAPQAEMEFEDQAVFLRTGNISSFDYYIASSDYPLKITLVWTDPAAALLANPTLINNLDLKVTSPDNTTTYYGNVFSGGFSTSGTSNASSTWDVDSDGFDERNNVECVFIPHTDVQVGVYKVQIIADNVGTDAVSGTPQIDQDFALVISGDLSEPNDVGIDSVEVPKLYQKNKQISITARIKNYGINNQTSPFNVRCIIKNPTGSELVNNTKIVSSLASFESINRIWNFTPTLEGQHSILLRTELINDDNNANNETLKYLMIPIILKEITTYTGVTEGDRFGWNVSFAGDLNGDGHSDVIIGAPYNDTATGSLTDAGAAYIFYGPKLGNYSAASADITIYGTSASDHFGWDVAGLGDINGTYDDVIIGAPGNSTSVPGKAYIFTGWTIKNDLDGILQATQADTIITGETNGDRFGCSVAGAGDVNNASNKDIIVGAYLNDNTGMTDNGRTYLFFGDGTISTSAGNADKIFNGTMDNEHFGFSVSCSGDMDADGIDDLIIGAPGANNKSGKSYLIGGFVVIPSGNVTYNFTSGGGKDKWFYHKNTGTDNPPSTGPDITGESELTSYSTIAVSDNIRTPLHPDSENSASANNYNRHHFRFTINEPKNSVTSLTVLWEGYDTKATSNLYIWNVSSSAWDSVGTGSSESNDNIIRKTYSSDAANYISTTGRLDLVVTAKDGSHRSTRFSGHSKGRFKSALEVFVYRLR